MLFKACEITCGTGVLAQLNGARGTVTDIIEVKVLFRYAVLFSKVQPTAYLTQAVKDVTRNSPDGLYTVPCGFVCECEGPTLDASKCLVCTNASRFDYSDLNDKKAPALHYCSPACRADHKQRHHRESDALANQALHSLEDMFQELDVPLTVTTVVFCCSACGKVPTGTEKLFNCGDCRQVRYCDRTCQKLDWWSGHNSKCRELRNS
jgi:hypothetical protein